MLNVHEHWLEEMRLSRAYVKECARAMLHTILFQRSIGNTVVEARTIWSEQLELAYCKLDDREINELVETKIREFADLFERDPRKSTGCVCVNFFTTKNKKPSVRMNLKLQSGSQNFTVAV